MQIGLSLMKISAKLGNSLNISIFSTEKILLKDKSNTVKFGNLSWIPMIEIIPFP
jgi:hypothetical protein